MIFRATGPIFALALVGILGCSSGPAAPDESSYIEAITAARAQKDMVFREAPDCSRAPEGAACSPIPAGKRAQMLPLRYFEIDPDHSVAAQLKLNDERPVFEMPTSTGTLRRMQLVGVLEFTVQGERHSLGAFVSEGTQQIGQLFVPFADITTGSETYAAGRYLDLHPTATGYYTIDFNHAYNPYCAYNASYECPFPPPSNRLKVPIRAGEKVPGA